MEDVQGHPPPSCLAELFGDRCSMLTHWGLYPPVRSTDQRSPHRPISPRAHILATVCLCGVTPATKAVTHHLSQLTHHLSLPVLYKGSRGPTQPPSILKAIRTIKSHQMSTSLFQKRMRTPQTWKKKCDLNSWNEWCCMNTLSCRPTHSQV